MRVCLNVYTNLCICLFVNIAIYAYIFMWVYVFVWTQVCTYECIMYVSLYTYK